jgi:urease accessory protein
MNNPEIHVSVRLPFDARCKSRLLVTLDSGEQVGLMLERGRTLRDGEFVKVADGRQIQVLAAEESLLEARSEDPLVLTKAAYHLGNRHVAVQVLPQALRFLNDHVLAEMVKGLGLSVTSVVAPFEPEGGAYGHHHAHGSQVPLATPKIHDFSSR